MKKYTYVWCRGITALESAVNTGAEHRQCRLTQCAEQEAKELMEQIGAAINASSYMGCMEVQRDIQNDAEQNQNTHAGLASSHIAASNMAPLKIAFAGCPNGCSQFQIADIAFVAAHKPELNPEACTGCGACVAACPETREHALTQGALPLALKMQDAKVPDEKVQDAKVQFHAAACSACGLCIAVCPAQALRTEQQHGQRHGHKLGLGWRLFVGGKLGRHPHLAQEYIAETGQHIWNKEAVIQLAVQFAEQFSREWKPRLRLAHLVWKKDV